MKRYKTFGDLIRKERRRQDRTMYSVAKDAGIKQTNLKAIEEGESSGRVDTAVSILRALNVNATYHPDKDRWFCE